MTFPDTDAVLDWLRNRARQESNVAPVWRVLEAAAEEVERLRAERDAARREYSMLAASVARCSPSHIARQRGWDCAKDAAEPRSST